MAIIGILFRTQTSKMLGPPGGLQPGLPPWKRPARRTRRAGLVFASAVAGERQQGLIQQVCTPQLLAWMQVGPSQVS